MDYSFDNGSGTYGTYLGMSFCHLTSKITCVKIMHEILVFSCFDNLEPVCCKKRQN